MSSVSGDLCIMPISASAEALAQQRVRDKHARLCAAIDRIVERYGVTLVELSIALGVFAPPLGKGGASGVATWKAGRRTPDDYNRTLIELLAEGELVLLQTGAEGGRKLYKVVEADEARAA